MPRDDKHVELDEEEWEGLMRVLNHNDTCKTGCDDFKYVGGETCREYRTRIKKFWGRVTEV